MVAPYRKKRLLFEICVELGECYTALGDSQAAEINFAEALDLKPRNPKPYTGLARVAVLKGEWEQAQSYLLKALEIKPEDDEALSILGEVMLAQGNTGAAWECWQRGLELNKGNKETLLGLVQAADNLEKLRFLVPFLEEYIAQHLVDFEVLYALAEARHRLGQEEEALEILGKILLFKPDHLKALALKEEIQQH